jgi:membrane associated rhomboid family serine protease
MIDAKCECGLGCTIAENAIASPLAPCPRCGRSVRFVSAEPLADGQGAGDFDTRLVFVGGPDRAGEQVLLGGCSEIEIGKLPERHLPLAGQKVSRLHCKLLRLDFGPSRWSLEDQRSTNGLFVNGRRVTEPVELRDGDVVQIGEYSLRYATDAARAAAASVGAASALPVKAIPVGGVNCPSCDRPTFDGAMICTDCGIYLHSGRPLITARGVDQDRVDEVAREAIWLPSFLLLMGFLPVASEAFGTHKPRATWAILALTVFCSVVFFRLSCTPEGSSPAVQNFLVWSGDRHKIEPKVRQRLAELKQVEKEVEDNRDRIPDYHLNKFRRELNRERSELAPLLDPRVGFRPYQLLTHALLHDTSSLLAFFFHLAGNTLFLLVFGLRINELIGNVRTAILYPLFAAFSGAVHMWGTRHGQFGGLLGASGAISGLAGMYFVLFPVQRVRMLAFLNLWILTAFCCLSKPFWLRGFWLLLLWFVWGDVVPVVFGWEDGTAHWAHLGGFVAGMVVALGLLFSRQVYARGDILSVALGKRAWIFVGKPSRYMKAHDAAPTPAPSTVPA